MDGLPWVQSGHCLILCSALLAEITQSYYSCLGSPPAFSGLKHLEQRRFLLPIRGCLAAVLLFEASWNCKADMVTAAPRSLEAGSNSGERLAPLN